MQFKFLPEDFKVKELISFSNEGKGNYYYYWLTKKDLSHNELIKILKQKYLINEKEIFFSGIKDKKALTQQMVCLQRKIPNAEEENYFLEFVGQARKKILIGAHKANEFEVVLRDLSEEQVFVLKKLLHEFKKKDFPNYFDEQRFGSGNLAQILGQQILNSNFEEAVKIFLTTASEKDSEISKNLKKIILLNWSNWKKILQEIPIDFSNKRKVFEFLLVNSKDFEKAFCFLNQNLLKRFLKQFQSFQFNQELKNQILKNNSKQKFIQILEEKFPLLVSRKSIKRFLFVSGFKDFKVVVLKRNTCFKVQKLKLLNVSNDELFSEKKKAIISFVLKKGCYATVFLKCLQAFFGE